MVITASVCVCEDTREQQRPGFLDLTSEVWALLAGTGGTFFFCTSGRLDVFVTTLNVHV